MLAAVLWLIALEVAGLLALPLAVRVFRRLADRGYGLAKALGLMGLGYACWLLSMLGLLNATPPTVLVLAALLGGGLWLWNGRAAVGFLRAHRALVLLSEAVFIGAYLLAVVVRAYGPAINGQEKFMDMAIYHAFLRSEQLPAEDPWLAGYGMAYYYFGYLLWGLVAKATAAPPAVGYNLALAGTLALLAAGVFALAYSLVLAQLGVSAATGAPLKAAQAGQGARPAAPASTSATPGAGEPLPDGRLPLPHGLDGRAALLALLGAVATAVMGNLQAAVEVAARHGLGSPAFWRSVGVKTVSGPGPGLFPDDGAWWFRAARVIPNIEPDGITEFPWFSLLLGDLHPHYVALPFDLLALGLAVCAFRNLLAARDHTGLDTGVAALALGSLIPLNTWDVGTFWTIYAVAVGAALLVARPAAEGAWWPALRQALGLVGTTFGCAIVLYAPYFLGYQSQPLGLGVVTERTMLGSLLVLFGPFLVLVVAVALRGWLDVLHDPALGPALRRHGWAAGLVGIVLIGLAVRDPTLAVLLALLLAIAPLGLAAWQRPTAAPLVPAGLLLLVCALGLLLGTELLFIRDTFGTRMNTVFKFHYHVWLLLGLLSPLLVAYLLRGGAGRRAGAVLGRGALALAAALLLGGLLYPLGATWTKLGGFQGPATLDGEAWLESVAPNEARAIRWLREQVPGRPVVVEAVGDDYTEYARVSTFAGLPTLIGWVGHELQWRGPLAEFGRRQEAAEAIYRRADLSAVVPLLQSLRAEYVYVGRLELEKYGAAVRERFEGHLEPVFRSGEVTIYRVPQPPSGVGVGLAEVRP
jgi:YYY domain-containing protein